MGPSGMIMKICDTTKGHFLKSHVSFDLRGTIGESGDTGHWLSVFEIKV